METKNPCGAIARASVSITADTQAFTRNRPLIQATPPMVARLRKLTWAWPWVPIRRRKIAQQGGAA